MPVGQEARVTSAERPRETRFVDTARQYRFVGAPSDSQFVDTPGEGRP